MSNKKHLNINTLPRELSLSPDETLPPIMSALGFTTRCFRHPIKFFRFTGEDFRILMDPDNNDPLDYYMSIRSESPPRYIHNFIYALQFLFWERCIIDADYRRRVMSIPKRIKVRSFASVRGMELPDNLDGYYCGNIMKVRDMLNADRELPMFNSRTGAELFGDIPTFDQDVWDRRYAYLLELKSKLV